MICDDTIPTSALGILGLSGLLVLGHLEELVGPAVRMGAVCFAELGNIHHFALKSSTYSIDHSLKMMQTHTITFSSR